MYLIARAVPTAVIISRISRLHEAGKWTKTLISGKESAPHFIFCVLLASLSLYRDFVSSFQGGASKNMFLSKLNCSFLGYFGIFQFNQWGWKPSTKVCFFLEGGISRDRRHNETTIILRSAALRPTPFPFMKAKTRERNGHEEMQKKASVLKTS